MNRTIVGLTTLLATMASTPLLAKVTADSPSQRVSTAGFDLTSPAGLALVRHRLVRAVALVCASEESSRLEERQAIARCRDLAMADGERQLSVLVANAETANGRGAALAMLKH